MNTIFVVLPFNMENTLENVSRIALAACLKLGEYLLLVAYNPAGFGRYFEGSSGNNRSSLSHLAPYIENMAQAHYVAFHPDWRRHKECQLLRAIAEAYELNIIDVTEPEAQGFFFGNATLMEG